MSGSWDLVVVGGGPAGSTLAALTRKYNPGRRVLLIERARFPRHHVGESLLIGVVPILKELGVYEKIASAGFPHKLGASYVWGKDRRPWDVDFDELNVGEFVKRFGRLPPDCRFSFQVRRAEYDRILLEHARGLGVEVREETAATELLEEEGRVIGVRLRGPSGLEETALCGTLADCSGQAGFLSRYRRIRRYDPRLGNVALHGYFEGARWKHEYIGSPEKTKIFVCSVDDGWFWYIPLSRSVISVGFVTSSRHLARRETKDLREHFLGRLRECRELAPLFKDAKLIEDFDGGGKPLHVVRDWSYLNERSSGPGWLAAGDACVFVDPILSSGVLLAHLAGHRAAYTLTTAWGEPDEAKREELWDDYTAHYRRAAKSFLAVALFWYGNDRRAKRWWKPAGPLAKAALPLRLEDRRAFLVVAAGVQDYYERIVQARHIVEESPKKPAVFPLFREGAWRRRDRLTPPALRNDTVLRLRRPYEVGLAFAPELDAGRLRPLKRVRFRAAGDRGEFAELLDPERLVLPPHLKLLEWLRKPARYGPLVERLADEEGLSLPEARRLASKFLSDLALLGVLSVRAGRPLKPRWTARMTPSPVCGGA